MGRKLTTEEFIERARAVYGDRYDYSQVEYQTSKTKVRVRCRDHGDFLVTPSNHIGRGSGCSACAGLRTPTTEQFVKRARSLHGDKYDYSGVEYINSKTKVCIRCPEHGEWMATPSHHIHRGHGCPECGGTQKSTTDSFIEKAREVHGDKYDYSKLEYTTAHAWVTIVCPEHGEFEQRAYGHLSGYGCEKCSYLLRGDIQRWTTDRFIGEAQAVHGDRYDYSESVYRGTAIPVKIICPVHGPFEQRPQSHVLRGSHCAKCAESVPMTQTEFLERVRAIHGDRYDYSNTVFRDSKTPITMRCPDHGEFTQLPYNHYNSNAPTGCPACSNRGFDQTKKGRLYYLRVEDRSFGPLYKIGITNSSVFRRFKPSDLQRIAIVRRWEFAEGARAREGEVAILRYFGAFKFTGAEILSSGNSELFTKDILGLDPQSPESPHPILRKILDGAIELPT